MIVEAVPCLGGGCWERRIGRERPGMTECVDGERMRSDVDETRLTFDSACLPLDVGITFFGRIAFVWDYPPT
jgi:hypothetical protein